jgi:hypothetical protein
MIFWLLVAIAGGFSFIVSLSLSVAGEIVPSFVAASVTLLTVASAISIRTRESKDAITPEQKTSIVKTVPFILLLLLFYATALFFWRDRSFYKSYVIHKGGATVHRLLK